MKWFIELIFFVPNTVIFPIFWTIRDAYSNNQLTIDSTNSSQNASAVVAERQPESSLLEKNGAQSSNFISPIIWQVPHDDTVYSIAEIQKSTATGFFQRSMVSMDQTMTKLKQP